MTTLRCCQVQTPARGRVHVLTRQDGGGWEVKGRALYSVWLVMKLIHGSLHRVIELLPLNRKLNSCAYSFDSCFAARNCYLQAPHHEGSLLSYFPGSHGAKVSHLESEFC